MIRTRHFFLKLLLAALVAGGLWLIYLDARITSTFVDKMWELPAKVYARPLELFAGARLGADELAYELEILGYRKVTKTSGPGQVARNRDRFEIYTRGFDFHGEKEPARRLLVELAGKRVQGLSSTGRRIDLMRLDRCR